jgi:hypothetical protein
MSDALCMISTGSGFSTRKLYTDSEMVLLGGQPRPMWLTGLKNVITRSDLADRAIVLNLEYVAPNRRKTENEFDAGFNQQQSLILGALLDLVSHTLARMPHLRSNILPRMADFARVASACETGFTEAGSFARAYALSAQEATHTVIEEQLSGVSLAVLAFMDARKEPWKGTATELLAILTANDRTEQGVTAANTWPKNYRVFGAALAEGTASLRKMGVIVKRFREGHGHSRVIQLELCRQADKADMQNTENAGWNGATPQEEPNRGRKLAIK